MSNEGEIKKKNAQEPSCLMKNNWTCSVEKRGSAITVHMLTQNQPWPSLWIKRRKMEVVLKEPSILDEVHQFLELKITSLIYIYGQELYVCYQMTLRML